MAAVGTFIHSSQHTLSLALTNAYNAAVLHSIPLYADSTNVLGNTRGVGHLGALMVHVNTMAGGCTSLIFRLSKDTAGNTAWIGDTTVTLSPGITTATDGTMTAKIDVDFVRSASDVLFLHAKTNAGTCTIDRIELTWRE